MSSPIAIINSNMSLTIQQDDSVSPPGVTVDRSNLAIARQFISSTPGTVYEYSGVYTPNNDFIAVHTWATNPAASVILVLTDAPVGIKVYGTVFTPVTFCTIDKIAMFRLAQFVQGVPSTLYLDGSPATNTGTVAQGVPIKWTVVVIDDATLT